MNICNLKGGGLFKSRSLISYGLIISHLFNSVKHFFNFFLNFFNFFVTTRIIYVLFVSNLPVLLL